MLTTIVYQNYSKKLSVRLKPEKPSLIYFDIYVIRAIPRCRQINVITNKPQFFDSRKTFKINLKYNRKNTNSL